MFQGQPHKPCLIVISKKLQTPRTHNRTVLIFNVAMKRHHKKLSSVHLSQTEGKEPKNSSARGSSIVFYNSSIEKQQFNCILHLCCIFFLIYIYVISKYANCFLSEDPLRSVMHKKFKVRKMVADYIMQIFVSVAFKQTPYAQFYHHWEQVLWTY